MSWFCVAANAIHSGNLSYPFRFQLNISNQMCGWLISIISINVSSLSSSKTLTWGIPDLAVTFQSMADIVHRANITLEMSFSPFEYGMVCSTKRFLLKPHLDFYLPNFLEQFLSFHYRAIIFLILPWLLRYVSSWSNGTINFRTPYTSENLGENKYLEIWWSKYQFIFFKKSLSSILKSFVKFSFHSSLNLNIRSITSFFANKKIIQIQKFIRAQIIIKMIRS